MIGLTMGVLVVALAMALSAQGRVRAMYSGLPETNKASLENVRDFAAGTGTNRNYAIEGGYLYAGTPLNWARVSLPQGVIANAVALDNRHAETVYVGAADELALYRSIDAGDTWLRIPLSGDAIGVVTDIAVDTENRLLYVGTDNAGIFRLRDVGVSVIESGHFAVAEPVLEVAADSTGAGMAFFRTDSTLFRSENGGLSWAPVDTLSSTPTAIEIANSKPPVVYVGTVDRGVLSSAEGIAWMSANDGLNLTPGSRLQVDALAVDEQNPDVLYVATSFLYGSTTLHESPTGVWMSRDGASDWSPVVRGGVTQVAELLPVSGQTGAVYALMQNSRSPLALGTAPVAPRVTAGDTAQGGWLPGLGWLTAWLVAVLAAVWLMLLLAAEVGQRGGLPQVTALAVRVGRGR
jgi:hypothetical protein